MYDKPGKKKTGDHMDHRPWKLVSLERDEQKCERFCARIPLKPFKVDQLYEIWSKRPNLMLIWSEYLVGQANHLS